MWWAALAVTTMVAAAEPLTTTPTTTTPPTTTRVVLMIDDRGLRARLARSLFDDGIAVVTAERDGPTHVVFVVDGADGRVVVCRGAVAAASVVPPGPAAFVELELAQRIKALTSSTAAALTTTATAPRVGLAITDARGDETLAADVVAAVLDADVGLDPGGGVPTLCVQADDVEVAFGVADAGAVCVVGTTVARDVFAAADVVAALPKRLVAPVVPVPVVEPMAVVTTPTVARSVGVGLGALGRPLAVGSGAARRRRMVDVGAGGAGDRSGADGAPGPERERR